MTFYSATSNPPLTNYKEKFRPQFHFTPKRNFINDPCGLVCFQGEYHLFHQYNPFDVAQNPNILYLRHAINSDLLQWHHMLIALTSGELVLLALIFLTPFGGGITIFVKEVKFLFTNLKFTESDLSGIK